MKKFAVILAGCGVFDGAEIHEATLTLLAIMQQGATYQIFAPDINQHHVVNHLNGGKISSLHEFHANEFDALIIPGGFGVAKNLCDFAFKGPDCTVNEEVAKAIMTMHTLKKPIGALCISPVLLSKVLGDVELTIGSDQGTIAGIEKMGSHHIKTTHGEVVHDKNQNIFTTPCYMLDANILQIYDGATNIVKAMVESLK